MSVTGDIRTALAAKITTATGLTPTDYPGDEVAMTSTRPAIYLRYSGAEVGRNEIIGGGITYTYSPVFLVYVGTDGNADTYLEQIRDAITGYVIPGVGQIQPYSDAGMGGKSEVCIDVHQGAHLYAQGWVVETLQ
jgi:hypothetical protein